ncbi:glutamate--cysteine ligase [Sansalvadorimonas verongulae]|uniref:glutamate--cysteine ligase n=1 Tax=Sansalvadorimonas verongulae TaxID=2172824 RepID=UPI0012BD43A3|nr:glutamate--cysteine ligase [Sansalvadorimonas verongulae]MTI14062.1 glutamate--cysteine ligase [Sansalvadorimonas verongulae]
MSARFSKRLQILSKGDNLACLTQIQHGIEKEGLRITPHLKLSQAAHPESLGSTLTHPYITTDYSEALLEFITPVYRDASDALGFLSELHTEALNNMADGEVVWASSMPAILEGDENIPVAYYGASNTGKMKHVYRLGLAHRYGKAMQTIAGIHYNFSLSEDFWPLMQQADGGNSLSAMDYQSAGYFATIRNFRRYAWLLSYLFGASPALDKSFLQEGHEHGLSELDENTLFLPWATSLRMSDLGYTSDAQSSLPICYNSLDNYVSSLWKAIRTPYADYEKIGKGPHGEYRQLNSNLLQIENEYYSTIRPKRVAQSGEKPVVALKERGVEYIEVRSLDINPLLPMGIDEQQSYFLDTFLLFCALQDSANMSDQECSDITENFTLSVQEGRKPGLQLKDGDRSRELTEWAAEVIEIMAPIAHLLDKANSTTAYSESLMLERDKVHNPSLTPSAIILAELQKGMSFREFSMKQSANHAEYFRSRALHPEREAYFRELAEQSVKEQACKEDADTLDFETFLQEYFASDDITV